jgi:hypothetical protein
MLKPHGLHIAPLPAAPAPPQTETERLVEMANRLPDEVWKGSGWSAPMLRASGQASLFGGGSWFVVSDDQFRTILLGVMAQYCGSCLNTYADCCLAIHARRASNAK